MFGDKLEYRVNQPLVFGEDITLLATDTENNKIKLEEYLNQNGIYNISIITFDQLRDCKLTGTKPDCSSTAPSHGRSFR